MTRDRQSTGPLLPAALFTALLTAAWAPVRIAAADWPQMGGPHRDGVSAETGLLRTWPADGPRVLWRRLFGEGFSAVAAVGDRLYSMDSDATTEYVVALDAATGAEAWRRAVGARFKEDFGDGPRATPTVDGGTVYAHGAPRPQVALKAADGTPLWEVDLPKDLASPVPTRGFTCSPLVVDDLLLLEAGGPPGKALVALDKQTGKVRWSARDGEAGYSSPLAVTLGGVPQVVFARRVESEVVALKLDGTVHWSHSGPPTVIAPPLFIPPDKIYLSGGDDAGAILLQVTTIDGKATPKTVWENRTMKNHFNPAVLVGGHLYGFDNGTFKCLDAATGEQTWAFRGLGKGSLIAADGLLVVLSDRGTLLLVEANPAAYTERSRFQAMNGRSWTVPTLAGGRLYLRDQDELVSLDLTTGASGSVAAPAGGAKLEAQAPDLAATSNDFERPPAGAATLLPTNPPAAPFAVQGAAQGD